MKKIILALAALALVTPAMSADLAPAPVEHTFNPFWLPTVVAGAVVGAVTDVAGGAVAVATGAASGAVEAAEVVAHDVHNVACWHTLPVTHRNGIVTLHKVNVCHR